MKLLGVVSVAMCLLATSSHAEQASFDSELDMAVTRFANLIIDAYAYEFRDARTVQVLKNYDGDVLAAAVVSIVGSGAGHAWDEYLAIFRGWDKNEEDLYLLDFPRNHEKRMANPYGIHLRDFIRIGGKGWRSAQAIIDCGRNSDGRVITMSFMEYGPEDSMSLPQQPATARFQLNPLFSGTRIIEIKDL